MNEPQIVTPALQEIILTPAEIRPADWAAICDESGRMILDETGLPILEG